jgi:hypothetical protein
MAVVASVVVVVVGVLVGVLVASGNTAPSPAGSASPSLSGPVGPEGVPVEEGPLLAPASTAAGGQTVDGVQCNSSEQVAYHIHTHLSVYVNGNLRPIPAAIGIVSPIAEQTTSSPFYGASRCYYWLHVHTQDGVIHIESPVQQRYTLADFFDLWGQPLGTDQVGPALGTLTVFVDGRPFTGGPRDIALGSHEDIQIDVGTPVVPPKRVDWSATSL